MAQITKDTIIGDILDIAPETAPLFLSIGGTYIFGFFALIALGSLVFALWLPETRNKSLEQIQKELIK